MNALIEMAIGLSLLYFLASLLVGAIVEYISAMFRMRARVIRDALTTMLGNANLVFDHPLVKPTRPQRANPTWLDALSRLFQKGMSEPSYVHSRLLAQALISPVNALPQNSGALMIRAAIENLPTVQSAKNTLDATQATQQELERWFNEAMKRWAGVYTRQSQAVSLLVCLVLVPVMNIDTVAVTRMLWNNPQTRMALATQASEVIGNQRKADQGKLTPNTGPALDPVMLARQAINDLNLPLGWPNGVTWLHIWWGLPGWLISIVAISAGSRFWFGTLNRLINMRLTGPPPTSADGGGA